MRTAFIILVFFLQFPDSSKSVDIPGPHDYFYWGVKYNNALLFDSNKDAKRQWAYTVKADAVRRNDSIQLFLLPDYSMELNSMIIIKDSLCKTMIRCFPGTDKVAIRDILRYISKEHNKVLLTYTEKHPEKDGTVVWDLENTYPRRGGYPRLHLTILE